MIPVARGCRGGVGFVVQELRCSHSIARLRRLVGEGLLVMDDPAVDVVFPVLLPFVEEPIEDVDEDEDQHEVDKDGHQLSKRRPVVLGALVGAVVVDQPTFGPHPLSQPPDLVTCCPHGPGRDADPGEDIGTEEPEEDIPGREARPYCGCCSCSSLLLLLWGLQVAASSIASLRLSLLPSLSLGHGGEVQPSDEASSFSLGLGLRSAAEGAEEIDEAG